MDILKESRGIEYFNNLQNLIGLSLDRWQEVIVKELMDNSLDAVDQLDQKQITVTCTDDLFSVCDNGGGIPAAALGDIYNFNIYVSSKRHTRTVSRGAQGNAVKSIIAICYLQKLVLFFVTGGQKITYKPDAVMIGLGHIEGAFSKVVETSELPDGVYIQGAVSMSVLIEYLVAYQKVNSDVFLTINGESYGQFTDTRKMSHVHSIHWYEYQTFDELVKRTALNHPEKTTKQFLSGFSKTQRIMSRLNLPGKLLHDFYAEDAAVHVLFDNLKAISEKFRPQILEKHSMGKAAAELIHGDKFIGYRKTCGEYELRGAEIPYLIEAVLAKAPTENRNSVTTSINNSVNYADIPFRFSYSNIKLACENYYVSGLSDILSESGFKSGTGHELFIHFVSPFLEFHDKAKSIINSDMFRDSLMNTIEPLITPVIKAVRRSQRESRIRPEPTRKDKQKSKKSLMFEYFMEGARIATGDWQYTTTARQVFYAIRKLVINNHSIVLNGRSDFSTLTQVVITTMFERKPYLEDKIYFERRGFYLDIESGEEVPMNTQRVNAFANTLTGRDKCLVDMVQGRYTPANQRLEYPYELSVASVLFVEKQGFTEVFKKSGILDELNLGLISSQGFGTRAIKKMMQDFIARGIKVYALTDGDIPGQIIAKRLTGGSNTFKKTLDINVIGLSYDDIMALDKMGDAEEYKNTMSYVNVLEEMNSDEKAFFMKEKRNFGGKDVFTYRRVELNALSMPELLDFIREKIPKRQLRPTREQIMQMVDVDPDALKRDVVVQHLMKQVDSYMAMLSGADVTFNRDKIADDIIHAMGNGQAGERWQDVLNSVVSQQQNRLTSRLNSQISQTIAN
jgi:5S rRNA maturation endonuclease (ribonuclease M5)